MNEIAKMQNNSLRHLLEKHKDQIQMALPKHLTPDRMLRIALTEGRMTPKLLQCSQASFLGAVIQCAQIGLEPGGALGHAYLVPYKGQVQLQIGYRGMLELISRSGKCTSVIARAVYADDDFDYEFGLNERLIHKPSGEPKKGTKITHVYCIARFKDGLPLFDVMTFEEVEAIRVSAKTQMVWGPHYEPMAKKTVVRRLFKFLPVSIEVQKAIGLDELADAGVSQGNRAIIDVEASVSDKVAEFEEDIKELGEPSKEPTEFDKGTESIVQDDKKSKPEKSAPE